MGSSKSAKHLQRRSVSTASLKYEELETVLVGIEAILNSRPIMPLSSDPNDLLQARQGHRGSFGVGEWDGGTLAVARLKLVGRGGSCPFTHTPPGCSQKSRAYSS